jgi:hypothetical protein
VTQIVFFSAVVECEDIKAAMDSAFWDRVSVLVKNEDRTDDWVQPDVEGHEKGHNVYGMQRGDESLQFLKPRDDWEPPRPKT